MVARARVKKRGQEKGRESFLSGPPCDRCDDQMPRRPRRSTGEIAYHVLNRRVGRLELFDTPSDYSAFEKILVEAHHRTGIRISTYCLMPNRGRPKRK